jgi:hypothetical protein
MVLKFLPSVNYHARMANSFHRESISVVEYIAATGKSVCVFIPRKRQIAKDSTTLKKIKLKISTFRAKALRVEVYTCIF